MSDLPHLFHIIEKSAWAAAQTSGAYRAASLEAEGFIHLSEKPQVEWVAQQFYQGQHGLLLLEIDLEALQFELRYDLVPGHGTFPHLYGPLNLNAVTHVYCFEPDADGSFRFPA